MATLRNGDDVKNASATRSIVLDGGWAIYWTVFNNGLVHITLKILFTVNFVLNIVFSFLQNVTFNPLSNILHFFILQN